MAIAWPKGIGQIIVGKESIFMSDERADFSDIRQAHRAADHGEPRPQVSLPPFIDSAVRSSRRGAETDAPPLRKRGRPATGKRSDPSWIGRTYYVKRATDLDVEGALLKLKGKGVEIDKSELVNSLLGAWVNWQQSGNAPFPAEEVLPNDE